MENSLTKLRNLLTPIVNYVKMREMGCHDVRLYDEWLHLVLAELKKAIVNMPKISHILDNMTSEQDINNILQANYQAIVDRGLITPETDFYDFMDKLDEETHELAKAYCLRQKIEFSELPVKEQILEQRKKEFAGELIDCLSVLCNMAIHMKIDIIQGLRENLIKNQERAKAK